MGGRFVDVDRNKNLVGLNPVLDRWYLQFDRGAVGKSQRAQVPEVRQSWLTARLKGSGSWH